MLSLQKQDFRPTNVPPSEPNIAALLTMGFSRDDATASLLLTNDNLDDALNNLLNMQS